MKDFLKYLWTRKIKALFLIFVLAFMGVIIYYLPEFELGWQIGAVAFMVVVTFASFYQVYKEWKDGIRLSKKD